MRAMAFKKKYLILLAATLAALGEARAERLPIKTYGTLDGLSSSFIEFILQDSHRYLWVCTRDGLSRFDGYSFKTYKTSDGLPVPNVSSIVENADGTFWVTTNGGGVCKFDPVGKVASKSKNGSLFATYSLGNSDFSNRANIVYKDRESRVWVGTDDGLFRLDNVAERETFKQVPLDSDSRDSRQPGVHWILEDRNGEIWIAASGSGVYRIFKDGHITRYGPQQQSAFANPVALLEDRNGHLWVGTRAGLCLIYSTPGTEKLNVHLYTGRDGLAGNIVVFLLETRDGHLWISMVNGLTEYDGESFRSYDTRNGLSGIQLTKMFEDRDGNLWIGTQSDGLMKFARNGFITYGAADDKSLTDIKNVFEDEAGNLFVVCTDWSLDRITAKGVYSSRLNMPADAATAWLSNSVLRDHAGEFWAITDGLGIFRFPKVAHIKQLSRTKPKAIYTAKAGLPGNRAGRAYEDSRGDIWFRVASLGRGELVRWERATETFHRFTEADGLPAPSELNAFYEAKDGNLWLAFSGGKIYRYSHGRFTVCTEPNAQQRDTITALFVDFQNRLWIADNQTGVVCVDNPTSDRPAKTRYSVAQGLSSDNARCIGEDRWGRIYVGTVRGLDRINTATGEIKHFSSADGLSSDFTKFIYCDRQSNLWIGTLKGISKFTPEPPGETAPPEIVIGGLRVSGEAQPINEVGETEIGNLELETGHNQVQIDFTAPAFGLGETLRFQYKLEGASEEWGPLTELRTVNYATLSPGSYRFLVRAVNGEGVASVKPARVFFTILPPIWRRWWFLALAAVVLAIPVSLIIRYRHERKRAQQALHREKEERLSELEQVRRRIATDLHDDIGSSLSQIYILSEVARQRVGRDNKEIIEPLMMISNASHEMVSSMSDIVWAITPQREQLSDLVQRMRRFASDTLSARDIELRFAAPDAGSDVRLGANIRREVFLIFKEAVNNLVKHSCCTEADVEFRLLGDSLFLRVSDNGRGFDLNLASDGHGLSSIAERARSIGGQLDVASSEGGGTTVALHVQLRQLPLPATANNGGEEDD